MTTKTDDLIVHDGVLSRITGWDEEDGARIADLVRADGKHTWCYWPSPRLTRAPDDAVFPDVLPVWPAPITLQGTK